MALAHPVSKRCRSCRRQPYRIYALATAAGQILIPPCVWFSSLSGPAYSLFPLLVCGWGMWVRRLEQELKATDSLIERRLSEVRLVIEPLPRSRPPTAFPAP
jgi:hypothetical protein